MEKEKEKKARKLPLDYMPQISNVASATECTGLIPTQPQNDDERDAYLELWSTSLPPMWEEE